MEYKIIQTKNFSYLTFNALEKYNVLNAIILRNNMGFSRNLEPNKRDESIKKIKEFFQIEELVQPHQNHTDISTTIGEINTVEYSDAVILEQSNIATLIATADCIPIIIYDPINNIGANIHAGWRGVVNKITEKTLKKMMAEYNSNPEELIICIGPCIRKDNFLVNEDVVEIYRKAFKDEELERYIIKTDKKNEKGINYSIDNAKLIKSRLAKLGIKNENIHDCKICTVEHNDDWYSYRREGNKANRIGTILMTR